MQLDKMQELVLEAHSQARTSAQAMSRPQVEKDLIAVGVRAMYEALVQKSELIGDQRRAEGMQAMMALDFCTMFLAEIVLRARRAGVPAEAAIGLADIALDTLKTDALAVVVQAVLVQQAKNKETGNVVEGT